MKVTGTKNRYCSFKVRGDADGGGGAAAGRSEDGGYERSLPSHGDQFAHKLISTVQKNPGQILR